MSINMTAGQTVLLVVTNTSGAAVCDFAVEAQFDSGGGVVAKTTETIRNFMNRRADLITSSGPSSGNFHDRFEGALFGEAGGVEPSAYKAAPAPSLRAMRGPVNDLGQAQRETIAVIEPLHPESERFASGGESGILNERISQMMSFSGGYAEGRGHASYSTSLKRLVSAYAGEKNGAAFLLKGENAAANLNPRFNIWSEGRYAFYRDNTGGADQKGHAGIFHFGADYLVHPAILVGALVQIDTMSEDSSVLGNSIEGVGWMAGPYASARLTQNLFFDARAAWGTSDNQISPSGTYTDKFDTTRGIYAAKLTGSWRSGAWKFTPNAELVYFQESQHAYTDTLGNLIPKQSIELGRLILGPEVGYALDTQSDGRIDLTLGLKGIWDFAGDDTGTVNGLPVALDDFRAKIEGGLDFAASDSFIASLMLFYDGIGSSDIEAYGARAAVRVRF